MPVFHVLVVVEVLAPLNQVVDLIVELVVLHVEELLVVEGVLVKLFKLLLEPLKQVVVVSSIIPKSSCELGGRPD